MTSNFDSKKFREILYQKKISIARMSIKTGLSKNTIHHLDRGTATNCTLKTLRIIENVLGLSKGDLIL